MSEQITISYQVFKDPNGNRFIFPGYFDVSDHSIERISWSKTQNYCFALKVEAEKELFILPLDGDGCIHYPYVVSDAISYAFAHGGTEVHLLSGPEFDKVQNDS